MARAIARGWGDPVLCSDGGSGRAAALVAELGGEALSNVDVAERADLVLVCEGSVRSELLFPQQTSVRKLDGVKSPFQGGKADATVGNCRR